MSTEADTKNKVGRPTIYTESIADEMCRLLMDGWSLNRICKLEHMPSRQTFYDWFQKNKEFLDKYAHAREAQGDFSADYLTDIAEDVRNEVLSSDRGRVMADIHKWVAARRAPRKYGDQINVNQTNTFKTVTDKPLTKEEETARWMAQFGNGPQARED